MFSGHPPGILVPGPTDTIYGSKAPAGGFFRFYQQGSTAIMVDHTRRSPTVLAQGRGARYGVGKPTPWGTGAVNFSGGEPFQVAAVGPLSGLSILGNGASTGFTVWGWFCFDPSNLSTNRTIFMNGASGGVSWFVNCSSNGTSATALINYGGSNAQGGGTATVGWNMFAFTFANKKGIGYLNGDHFGSDFSGSGTPVAETGNLFLGGGGVGIPTACALDHVGIDVRPYSPVEVRELYRNPFHMFKRKRVLVEPSLFTVAQTHNFFF